MGDDRVHRPVTIDVGVIKVQRMFLIRFQVRVQPVISYHQINITILVKVAADKAIPPSVACKRKPLLRNVSEEGPLGKERFQRHPLTRNDQVLFTIMI